MTIPIRIERLQAAEDVCHTLMLMMATGMLEIHQESREFLAKSMDKWVDMATEDGILKEG